ncbi:MAG: hypothetical protein PHV17_00340 [Candidatus Omnitrophica bacterium]|nr:hypothetical protein [Candidatus Omnitrophota bacterium]
MLRQQKLKAFTIAELMISTLIILMAVLPLYQIFISALQLTAQSREIGIATNDLKDIFEYIKGLSFQNVTVPSSGGFSNGSMINSSIIGEFLLENETITISFPNGTNVDPLVVSGELTYTGKDQRVYTHRMTTIRTNY